MSTFPKTPRSKVRRIPQNAVYDRAAIDAVLDEALICHVGFVVDGLPYVIPTSYARAGDKLYIHGSAASRMVVALSNGIDVCVTVTLLDGLVLARSAFNHSMNYRSVVIFGKASAVEDPAEKLEALRLFAEHIMPGRWQDLRDPKTVELKATLVLCLPIAEVSAKMRSGPPVDDADDMSAQVWAGVLPLALRKGELQADSTGIEPPEYLRRDPRW
ncbi:MAG TPA: pyridoxamine 5'-phosphate oxidase family protein [Candidatus Eremiobacteraceae bacterium]|nr:pyridoxamine 5'-phosphate oxidase family protein [Candidatus Eremiobacteraceae bacterium]